MDENDTKIKIDLQNKKSEYGWQMAMDNFFLKATPKIFEWIGWVIVLGGLYYVANLTSSDVVNTAYFILLFFTFYYFQGFFYSFEFHRLPFISSEKWRRTFSLLISGTMTFLIMVFIQKLIIQVSGVI